MSKISVDSYHFLGIKAVPFVSAFFLSMSGMLCLAPVPALADDEEDDDPLLLTTQTLNDAISGISGNYNPGFSGFIYSPQPSSIPSEFFQSDIQDLLGDNMNSLLPLFDSTEDGTKYTGAQEAAQTGYLHFYWEKDAKGNYKLMQAWGNRFTSKMSESADFAFSLAYQNYFKGTKTDGDSYKYDWAAPDRNNYLNDSSIVRFLGGEGNGTASDLKNYMDVCIETGNKGQILKTDGTFTDQNDGQSWKTGINGRVYADLKGNYRAIVAKGKTIPYIRNTAFIDNNYNGNPFIQVQKEGKIGELGNVTFINNFTTTTGTIRGGSIYNEGEIGNISGTFIGNYIRPQGNNAPWGGAIVNMNTGTIGDISGYFVGNHIQGEQSGGLGGAICSQGQIRSLTGVFIGNYTSTGNGGIDIVDDNNMRANSGVIRNYSAGAKTAILGRYDTVEIDGEQVNLATDYDFNTNYYKGKLKDDGTYEYDWSTGQLEYDTDNPYFHVALGGVFIGNWSSARGGVLFNNGEVHGMINGDFICNYIYSRNGLAQGGAIANDSSYKLDAKENPHLTTIAGTFTGNYVYNATEDTYKKYGLNADGGAIFNRNAEIGNILADFENNYAVSEEGAAHGGAIYNIQQKYRLAQDDVASTKITDTGMELGSSSKHHAIIADIGADRAHKSKFTGNYAQGKSAAEGGAIYISTNFEKQDQSGNITNADKTFEQEMGAAAMKTDQDLRATLKNVYADFTENYAEATGKNGVAYGGAIFVSNYGETGRLYGTFDGNKVINAGGSEAEAKGGALYIGQGAIVDRMYANFTNNEARGEGQVRGGAMLVTKGATIGHISGAEGTARAQFTSNKALGSEDAEGYLIGSVMFSSLDQDNKDLTEEQRALLEKLTEKDRSAIHAYKNTNVYGGAIRFDDSFIAELSADFDSNVTNGSGGAISITESGFLYKVTGDFSNNAAGIEGGAVHNLGTIGYLGDIAIAGENGTPDYKAMPDGDSGDYSNIVRDEQTGAVLTRSDATGVKNKTGYGEYDGSIRGGFENTQFLNNTVNSITLNNGNRGKGAAIYTTDDLFLTVTTGNEMTLSGNTVYYTSEEGTADTIMTSEQIDAVPGLREALDKMPEGTQARMLNTAIYVDNIGQYDSDGTLAQKTVYLVAEQNAKMIITDAIRGQEVMEGGFILRLRGYRDKNDAAAAHRWTDDIDNTRGIIALSGPIAESYVIMDDVRLSLDECINKYSFGKASPLDSFVYGYEEDPTEAEKYKRSDIFRRSAFDVRSGLVDLTGDGGKITQFAFGTITAYGKGYTYIDNAYEGVQTGTPDSVSAAYDSDVYAHWRVNINLSNSTADLITTFEVRDGKGAIMPVAGGNGYQMSVGRITLDNFTVTNLYDEFDNSGLPEGLDEGHTIKVQILNLIVMDGTTGTILDNTKLTTLDGETIDYTTSEKTPIQLDTDFEPAEFERAKMSTDDVLAKAIRLATTRSYHDSIEIIGWRNTLAAWAELTEDANDSRYENVDWDWNGTDEKVFTLKTHYALTRHVEDLKGREGMNGTVYGDTWTINSSSKYNTLDMQEQDLLTKVLSHQTARLENFSLLHVMGDTMTNDGVMLTLDTMTVEDDLKIVNNTALTVTGKMTINNTITSDASQKGTMFIENSSNQGEQTIIDITGTVQNQNIIHRVSGDGAIATLANEEVTVSDDDATITNLPTTQNGKVTQAFLNFTGNSLTMQGGTFNLGDMALNRLKLVNFNMNGGKVNVNSSTVDLANKTMGGIDAGGTAAGNNGTIWLDKISLISDGEQKVTHVKFAPKEVGDTVQDNNIRDNTAAAPIWEYAVTYNDTEKGGSNGYYTFTRTNRVNPAVQVGPVNDQTTLATALLIHDYAFEHANLYSDALYQARREELYARSYSAVTPMKGKDYSPAAETADPSGACGSTRSKGTTGSLRALWARPYASFENVALSGGPKVSMNLYGALVGADSNVTQHRGGWLSVFTGYLGYVGSEQKWSGNRTRTNGGVIGATETLYKGNFYTAITVSAGLSNGNAHTMYGREDFHTIAAGAAARAGYNIALDACAKYVLQTSLQVAYTYITTGDYTNRAGVHMESDALQALQVNPFIKFFIHAERDWTPYAVAGYVWNLGGKSSYRANGDKLPELSIDPYVEYGLGVQKVWKDRYTFYGQATGRSGGRQGYELSVGVRWNW